MNIETLFDSIQLPPEMRPCPQDDHKRWVCYREDETHKFGYQFDSSDKEFVCSRINIDDCYQRALHDAHTYLLYQGYTIHLVYTTEFDVMIEGFGYKRAMNAQGGISNQQDVSNYWDTQFEKHINGSAQLPSSYPDFEVVKDALQQIMTLTAKTLKSRGLLQPATESQLGLTMGVFTGKIDEETWKKLTHFQSDAQLMYALGINIEKLFGFCLSSLNNAMSIQQASSTVSSMRGSQSRETLSIVKAIDKAILSGLPKQKTADLIKKTFNLRTLTKTILSWVNARASLHKVPEQKKPKKEISVAHLKLEQTLIDELTAKN